MRRALGIALCYAFAFQAFFSAYSAALAVTEASGAAATFIICHNAGDEAPAGSDTSKRTVVPCAMCAIASAAIGLPPDSASTIAAPSAIASKLLHADITVTVGSLSVRAGLARAPPQFG
jgi:hypothetical protein